MFRIVSFFIASTLMAQGQINTAYDEQSPVLTPDQTELYFTVGNHLLNVAGKRDAGDIWFSRKVSDKWSTPELVKGLINNGGYNAVLGFSQDGQEMFLYGHYSANGDAAGSQGISVSKRNGSTWSLPRNETIPYFLNKSVGSGGSITPDKKVFVFSAEARSHDSFGNEDIYVSFNRDGVWTEPLNLGAIINTPNQELSPYYHYSTSTLFFSSNKPGGYGSFDVYQCDRLDDTWQNWSKPALVDGINSEGRELFFSRITSVLSIDLLFTSTKNSDGYGDIRERSIPNERLNDSISWTGGKVVKSEPSLVLRGKVFDSMTGEGIPAFLELYDGENKLKTQADKFGTYGAKVLTKGIYSVSIDAPGYLSQQEQFDLSDKPVDNLEINFKLQPIAVGVSVNLKHVLFRQSSPELLPESYDELDKVVNFLNENPTVEIELSGHTDDAGKASLNLKLSRDRVNRVKYYLAEKGIAAARVKGVGYGETRPITSNKTDEGRKMNRRVEFKILKK